MSEPVNNIDEQLKQWATARQIEYINAVNQHGSIAAASRALDVDTRSVSQALEAVKKKAARAGYSPEHDMTRTVPSPYVVKGTSTLYDKDGNQALQWVKTSLDRERFDASLREYVEWLSTETKGLAPITPTPKHVTKDLLSVYAIGDPHLGLYSWAEETGQDFDLKISETLISQAIDRLVSCSPDSERALILELGDLLHADDSSNSTPSSHHTLDVDTRYAKVMQVALRALKHAISRALEKHQTVDVWIMGGNHDPHSSFAIAMCLSCFYESEPRVNIDLSPSLFKYLRFGKVLIGSTHGHAAKMPQLPAIMATDKAQDWGQSTYRYWYCGHIHHKSVTEHPGVVVETFGTLAARDAWHAGKGYRAGRDMQLIVHHAEYGEIERHRADIAMLGNEP